MEVTIVQNTKLSCLGNNHFSHLFTLSVKSDIVLSFQFISMPTKRSRNLYGFQIGQKDV